MVFIIARSKIKVLHAYFLTSMGCLSEKQENTVTRKCKSCLTLLEFTNKLHINIAAGQKTKAIIFIVAHDNPSLTNA